jgi:hypothetical protein
MPDHSLPVRNKNHKTGRKGVRTALIGVEDSLGWIFREQPQDDYGIDAHIEVVATGDDLDTVPGQLIGAQIKGGETQGRRAKDRDGWYYYSTKLSSLNYWLGHTLPVIVVVYDKHSDTSYWQVIRSDLVEYTKKGFKVFVPRSQPLNNRSRQGLVEVAKRTAQRALEVFDRSLARLPKSVETELRRATPSCGVRPTESSRADRRRAALARAGPRTQSVTSPTRQIRSFPGSPGKKIEAEADDEKRYAEPFD